MTTADSPAIRHAHLVQWVVGRHFRWLIRYGYDFEDLIQEGYYAVLVAAPLYDPAKGAESSYYVRAVRHWIINRVAVPMNRKKRGEAVRPVSLDSTLTVDLMTGAEVRLGDILPDPCPPVEDVVAERVAAQQTVQQALGWLGSISPRQAEAVWLRYGRDMPVRDVGKAIGRSHQNAADLALRGLKNLREYMTSIERSTQHDQDQPA